MNGVDPEALTGRVAGFVAHLRLNDFAVGPGESVAALDLLGDIDGCDPRQVRFGFKSLLAGRKEEWERFDDLFEAYWYGRGRVRRRPAAPSRNSRSPSRPDLWRSHLPELPAGGAERAKPSGAHGEDDDEPRGTAAWWRPVDRRSRRRICAILPTPASSQRPSVSPPAWPAPCATASAGATGTRTGLRASISAAPCVATSAGAAS